MHAHECKPGKYVYLKGGRLQGEILSVRKRFGYFTLVTVSWSDGTKTEVAAAALRCNPPGKYHNQVVARRNKKKEAKIFGAAAPEK